MCNESSTIRDAVSGRRASRAKLCASRKIESVQSLVEPLARREDDITQRVPAAATKQANSLWTGRAQDQR
jgi:hypothetical protein